MPHRVARRESLGWWAGLALLFAAALARAAVADPPSDRASAPASKTPVAAPPQSVMVRLVTHYTIAFWKTFLEGDHRYMRYLTPGYANVHGFPTQVTIAE